MVSRNPFKTGRPADQPLWAHSTGRDLELRRLVVPPSFIDQAVLVGGDEYVKAEDLATIVNAFIEEMELLRSELLQMKFHLAKMSNENIAIEGIED